MNKKLLIFSAPSGSGKSTIINWLMQHEELHLAFSISCTSRAPRGTEQNGVEYFFLSAEEFRQRIANDEFLEYEEVYKDRFYGTLKQQVENQLAKGENVVFDLDVKGGCNIKQFYGDRALSIFRSVSSTTNETAAQLLNRRRLNEQAQRAVAVILLDVATALHVDVEHHVLAARSLRLHLLLQRAVEAVLVNLLVLEKLVAADALAELLGSDEEILYAVLLCATRSTRCARDREGEVQLRALHQTIDDCALSAATRSGEYYKFTHVLSFEFKVRSAPVP